MITLTLLCICCIYTHMLSFTLYHISSIGDKSINLVQIVMKWKSLKGFVSSLFFLSSSSHLINIYIANFYLQWGFVLLYNNHTIKLTTHKQSHSLTIWILYEHPYMLMYRLGNSISCIYFLNHNLSCQWYYIKVALNINQ